MGRLGWFLPVIRVLLALYNRPDSLHWHKAENLINSQLLNQRQVVIHDQMWGLQYENKTYMELWQEAE